MGGEVMIRRFQLLAAWWERRKIERVVQKVIVWAEPYVGEVMTPARLRSVCPELSDDMLYDVWDALTQQRVFQRHPISKRWIITYGGQHEAKN